MKTVALSDMTWEKLKSMREKEKLSNLNEVIDVLIKKSEKVPKSMFGTDRGSKSLSLKEHEDFQREFHG
jgi:predicted CopG family antitoxin